MQTWVAVALLVGQGIFLLIARSFLKAFGKYMEVLVSTQQQNIDIRKNMAIQENDRAAMEALHHRRHDDPPPFKEELA